MPTEAFAPAKINLTLHVVGTRADGYHLLDSLVVFAGVGDSVTARPAPSLTLDLTGPEATGLADGSDNLVLRAARFLGAGRGAALTLVKNLPVSSGIGGGSSDAAAALRALAELWALPLPAAAETAVLGADVPVCLGARPRRMAGIGEVLSGIPALPPVWLVLANPRVAVPTPAVFAALGSKRNPPMPAALPAWPSAAALADFLRACRNDLEEPAAALAPVIGELRDRIAATEGCLLARMSGSGATCFGLYADARAAGNAALALGHDRPAWWIAAAPVLPAT